MTASEAEELTERACERALEYCRWDHPNDPCDIACDACWRRAWDALMVERRERRR